MSREMKKYETEAPEHVQQRPWMAPRVDIYENPDEILLLADVPGVRADGLRINLEKNELTLEGTVEEEAIGGSLGSEYRAADYRRVFTVPWGIDEGKISANLKDGVLTLRLPKSSTLKPRQIQVKAG